MRAHLLQDLGYVYVNNFSKKKMDKGDNPKARGLKHIKNKKKYNKGKTGAHLAPPKPKSTPALASNWDRYEQEAVIQTVNSSTDFSLLANIPITHGSHFQFKSDKNIAEEINVESDKSSPLFNLDLSLLDKSLSTIPFYNRSDVDEKYFTENQQRIISNAVRSSIEDYSAYLKSNDLTTNSPGLIFNLEDEAEDSENDELVNNYKLDNESFMKEPVHHNIETPIKSSDVGEPDLEQWLDDILDD